MASLKEDSSDVYRIMRQVCEDILQIAELRVVLYSWSSERNFSCFFLFLTDLRRSKNHDVANLLLASEILEP